MTTFITFGGYKEAPKIVRDYLYSQYPAVKPTGGLLTKCFKNSHFLFATTTEKPIGFLRYTTDEVTVAVLLDLFVVEDFRRKGVATRLLKTFNERYFHLIKILGNNTNHDLYFKAGYLPCSVPTLQLDPTTRQPNIRLYRI